MKLSIYEVYVNIEDQEQADRMKQICIDYGLPYWGSADAFLLIKDFKYFSFFGKDCWIGSKHLIDNKTQVTESEFLELVKINFANSK